MDSSPTKRSGDPDTVASALQDIQAQLTQLNERMARVEQLAAEGKGAGAVVMDSFDAHINKLQEQGVDVGERLSLLQDIGEALTRPEVLRSVHRLARQTDQVTGLLQILGDLPGVAGTVIDIFDSMMDKAKASGLDIDGRLSALIAAGNHLSSPDAISTLEALFDPEVHSGDTRVPRLSNPILQLFIDASGAVREVSAQPPKRTGLFGLMRAGRDKDIQTFTDFSIRLVRSLGQRLAAPDPTPPHLENKTPSITE